MRSFVLMIGAGFLATAPAHAQDAAAGAKVFAQCKACHQIGENAKNAVGPVLNGLFGSQVALANGNVVTADATYIRESILNPTAKVVQGYAPIMPTFQGQVSEEQLLALIEYIKSLPTGTSAPGASTPGPAVPTGQVK